MFRPNEDHPTRIAPPLEIVPDQWYAVLETKKLRREPVAVRRLGEELVLYRTESAAVACLVDRCPHRGVALSLGRVTGEEIECGYHAFRFRADGTCTAMPCEGLNAKVPLAMRAIAFPAREAHGLVWVWWGAARAELPPIPWIPEVPSDTRLTHDHSRVWPITTVHSIESAFDYHHAPVLHGPRSLRFTKSRYMRLMEDVTCEVDGEHIEFKAVMREEGGTRGGVMQCHTSFRMPGNSLLRIGPALRIGLLDTPVDAGTTWRFARRFNTIGNPLGLGKLIIWLMAIYDSRTQDPEDLPMVTTQANPVRGIFSDIYVKADAGCAKYDQLRIKLLRAARENADSYPMPVRLRLGAARESTTAMPVPPAVQTA